MYGKEGPHEPGLVKTLQPPRKAPYDVLLQRILLGDYPPGAQLTEPEIAKELCISRTPVREALLRLRLEGLVEIIPRGGIFVVEAPIKLIREVTEVRLVLEECLARLVVERRTAQWLGEYEQWLRDLEMLWPTLAPREWMRHDLGFHERLHVAARNEILASNLRRLQRQAVLFWTQSIEDQATLECVITDYRDTLQAAKERDFRACAGVLRRHVLEHVERIRNHMKFEELRHGVVQRGSSKKTQAAVDSAVQCSEVMS